MIVHISQAKKAPEKDGFSSSDLFITAHWTEEYLYHASVNYFDYYMCAISPAVRAWASPMLVLRDFGARPR